MGEYVECELMQNDKEVKRPSRFNYYLRGEAHVNTGKRVTNHCRTPLHGQAVDTL